MKNIKNTLLVSALSLGLVVGAVGVVSAATTTDYQQKIANWIKNDPNPMVMTSGSSVGSTNTGNMTATTGTNLSTAAAVTAQTPTTDASAVQTFPNQNQTPASGAQQPTPPQPAPQPAPKKPSNQQPLPPAPTPDQQALYNQMVNNCIEWDQQMMQQYHAGGNNGYSGQNWNGNRMSGNWSGNMGW